MSKIPKLDPRSWSLYATIAFLSLVISIWSVYQDNVINDDAVWYLEAARLFTQEEWRAAYSAYAWPLYPLLISLVSQVTGLTLEYAAHLLNAILHALTVVVFVKLAWELSGDREVTVAAAILILIYPTLNEYRSIITRDAGYWAFFLLGVLLYIKYFSRPSWRHAISWALSMLVATLFRFEGVVFLLFVPLAALVRRDLAWGKKIGLVGQASSVMLVFMPIYFLVTIVLTQFSFTILAALRHPVRMLGRANFLIIEGLSEKADVLGSTVLSGSPKEYAVTMAIAGIIVILVIKFIKVMTPIYVLLMVYAVKKKIRFALPNAHPVWVWLIILNVLILVVFVSKYYFLQGRYMVPLCFLVLLPISFVLASIYRGWCGADKHRFKNRWGFAVACMLLVVVTVDGFVSFGPDKVYIKQAGAWVKQARGESGIVFANDQVLFYYAGEKGVTAQRRNYSWAHTLSVVRDQTEIDYYAIRVSRKFPAREKEVEAILGEPVKRFANRRGDRVLVFAGRKSANS